MTAADNDDDGDSADAPNDLTPRQLQHLRRVLTPIYALTIPTAHLDTHRSAICITAMMLARRLCHIPSCCLRPTSHCDAFVK